ncbi:MAG: sensor histidine kinase, partial [Spirochaetia bacterium]
VVRLEGEVETRTAELRKARLRAETERRRAEKYLEVSEAIVVELDRAGSIDRINARGAELLGYPAEAPLRGRNWFDLAVPAEMREQQKQSFADVMAGRSSVQEHADREIVMKDGGRRFIHWHTVLRRHADGSVAGTLSSGQDVTERRNAEREKEVLLKEVHHRTKNNMQVIISLLALQVRRAGSDAVRAAMTDAQNRIMSMALVHGMLYESENLAQMALKRYISELAGTILAGYSPGGTRIGLQVTGNEIPVTMETAVQCGLVLNEIITNTTKHAFTDGAPADPQVTIDVGCSEGEVVLRYRDNGVGFPEDFIPDSGSGVGMQVVTSVVRDQLRGSITFDGSHGAAITFRFPKPDCDSYG